MMKNNTKEKTIKNWKMMVNRHKIEWCVANEKGASYV